MSIFKKALEFLRDKKEEKIKELETKLLSAQTDIFKLGVKNADLELSLKSAELQSKSQNAECKNKLIYNANNQYVVVIDCNSDSFEGYITPDKVEQLKSADTQTIINLLTPPKVEEKGSDFDVDKEEKEIVSNFLDIFNDVDDFEVVGNSVFFKNIRSVEIPSLIVARFVEILDKYRPKIENLENWGKSLLLDEEYQSLKAFTLKLLLNPLPHSREDLVVFMRNNDIRISKAGNLILYRNIVKVGKTNKSLVEFVSNQYFKVKGWKKNPSKFKVVTIPNSNVFELKSFEFNVENTNYICLGDLKFLYNNLSELKENTYTSWHNKGRYTIKIGSIYKIDETLEKLNTTRYACQGGALHAVNYSYNYSYFGDTKVVVLVNPSKVLTIPSNDSGKITTREMWVACYNPNELGVHFDETGLEGVEDEYENYTNEELGGILKSKCLSPISIDGFTSELSLKDVESISNMLKNRIVTI